MLGLKFPGTSRTPLTRKTAACSLSGHAHLNSPNTYVLLEAFRDDDAGSAHVQSAHFREATENLPAYLSDTPDIINVTVDGWAKLGELAVSAAEE